MNVMNATVGTAGVGEQGCARFGLGRSPLRWARTVVCTAAALIIGLSTRAVEPTAAEARLTVAAYSGPYFAGVLANPELNEASGLTASRRDPDLFWSHNDSDAGPRLYALGSDGRNRGAVTVRGATNVDWEAIRSFTWQGRSWLLIGDVGFDNGKRTVFKIYVLPEPDPSALSPEREIDAEVAWSFPFAYADGKNRDCESVGVDVNEGAIYLLEKRVFPSGLYRLPLKPATDGMQTPVRISMVDTIPQPDAELAAAKSVKASWRANATDMDFAADGSAAVVMTYSNAYLFARAAGESWIQTFAKEPQRLPLFHLDKAEPEAVCFAADSRTIFLTCEKPPAPLLRYERLAIPPTR